MNPFPWSEAEIWPPNYTSVFMWRQRQIILLRSNPVFLAGAKKYYADPAHAIEFIEQWMTTYDPRNAGTGKLAYLPFCLFPKQRELCLFILACLQNENSGLVEKCRDMGATWLCAALSVWLWLFVPGMSIGWGSRKEDLVDELGVADSIFEKMRILIRNLPPEFLPNEFSVKDHMPFARIINPETDAIITGEVGDNIGRGGRKRIYFKDESAHYTHPELIEAALSENTRVQIDISSVNGIGNVFERRRANGIEWQVGMKMIPHKTYILVMDWRDHPEKTISWYTGRRQKFVDDGLLHIFRQEIDRDYGASVVGVIIKPEWVNAAVDAHWNLEFDDSGPTVSGLDVADGGGDRNAQVIRKGPILKLCEEWGAGEVDDTGETARRAITNCAFFQETLSFQYDSIGVGAGVKSETNRFKKDGLLVRKNLTFQPWAASAKVLYPEARLIKFDKDTPLNGDYFANLKAQAWFELARRFERTWRAVTLGHQYKPEELISLPSSTPNLGMLRKQLSQATMILSTALGKMIVDKAPEGSKSPNLADACVMAFWPIMPIIAYTEANIGR